MARAHGFEDLKVWQLARELVLAVYQLTNTQVFGKDHALRDQIRRAAVSSMANIAEGFGRKHTLDKVNFYFYARGSLTETQSHLEYGRKVGYIMPEDVAILDSRLSIIHHDLNKLISGITSRSIK